MKHLHVDVETDGFCGAHWACASAEKYPQECRGTQKDIEKRMCRVLSKWKGEK